MELTLELTLEEKELKLIVKPTKESGKNGLLLITMMELMPSDLTMELTLELTLEEKAQSLISKMQ